MGTFGARLKQARLDLAARRGQEIRQTDIAGHMGVSRAAYSQWEGGGTEPKNRKDYEKLGKYLGVDPGWLAFGGTHLPIEDGTEEPVERPTKRVRRKKA